MALSLGIRIGAKFKLGDKIMTVLSIGQGAHAVVEVGGKTFNITDQKSVEVCEGVRVSFGPDRSAGGCPTSPRLAFEAPRVIPIVRL